MKLASGLFMLSCACLCVAGGALALIEFFKTGKTSLLAFGIAMCVSGGSSLTVAFRLARD